VKISEWDLGLSTRELEDPKGVLELVSDMKNQGVTGAAVARSFCRRMIQPIKDRVHPAYEHCGQSDPTREVNRKVSKKEMAARVSQIFWEGQGEEVPEGTLVEETSRPGEILRSVFRSLCFAFLDLLRSYSIYVICRCANSRCGARRLSQRGRYIGGS
jgi:hypothetical protein